MSVPRLTHTMISRGVLADLNDVAVRVSDTQRKLSSGKELTRPSDDPFSVGRALSLRGELDATRQYRRNASEATGWVEATDTALGSMTDIAQRARELVLSGANDPTGQQSRNAIAQEIDQLVDAAKQAGNASYAGSYLLSGTATNVRPYGSGSDAYNGDTFDIARSIGPGVAVPINVRASDVLGDGTDGKLIDTLRDIAAHLRGGTPADITALRGADLVALDGNVDELLNSRAQVGAVSNRLAAAEGRLAELEETATDLLSKTEDADMAATIIDYSMQQSVYQSALRAGAGIMQTSLLDFLR